MFEEEHSPAALRLAIGEHAAERIRAWQQQLNLEIIRRQIARSGRAIVIRYRSDHRLQPISEEPAMGEAEPWYGEIGGLYTYTFTPEPAGCKIQVEMTDRGAAGTDALTLPSSLVMPAGGTLDLVSGMEHTHHPLWLRPDIWDEGTSLHEVSGGELSFWIDGEMYQRLVVMGWSRAHMHAYRYRFTPLTVGCDIVVHHGSSGQAIHLTRHIQW